MKTLILMSVLATIISAQSGPDRADPVIQAAEIFEHARALRGACDYAGAERWLRRAYEIVRGARIRAGETDAAGTLAARIEIDLANLRDLRKRLDHEEQVIGRLIGLNQVDQARQRFQRAGFPVCDSRFDILNAQIEQAQFRLDHPTHCDACRKVIKVIVWTAVAGGIGYGGYRAYEKWGPKATPSSVPRSPAR